jgi:hypothetical protein
VAVVGDADGLSDDVCVGFFDFFRVVGRGVGIEEKPFVGVCVTGDSIGVCVGICVGD